MDTKSKAERFLNMMTGDESMLAQDGIEVAQAYLDQCQEVDRLSDLMFHVGEFLSATTEGHRADAAFEIKHCYLEIKALKDKTMNDLLICAKAVGHEGAHIHEGICRVCTYHHPTLDHQDRWEDYNPLTKDAQAMELLKLLIDRQFILRRKLMDDGFYWIRDIHPQGIEAKGKTLNEAIVNACVEMMKNE